ncbi:MAG: hypothetical protein KTR20_14965 [Cellvibrionaceae bacterium]|nr:hypothetical protein [Cellvibrionaceae bacterium]
MNAQRKNIYITVALSIGFMVLVLALFLNKMTTARYLSNIELKINGLIMLSQPIDTGIAQHTGSWRLLVETPQAHKLLGALMTALPKKIQQQTTIIDSTPALQQQLANHLPDDSIAIINQQGQLMAYFKSPFNQHKMKLTYASVVTHR